MAVYYAVVEGDPLDNGGNSHVIEGASHATIEDPDGRSRGQTHLGQKAWCSICQSMGVIAAGAGISDYLRGWNERLNAKEAIGGDIVLCKCERAPRIVSVYARCCEYIDVSTGNAAGTLASNAPLPSSPAEPPEELEHYFEIVDAKTEAPIEGMTYQLSSNGRSLVHDAALEGGRTLAFSLKEHPHPAFGGVAPGECAMSRVIRQDMKLLAAIAYGEASTANDSQEIGGIAFAVVNRCREWGGKTVSELRAADPNYSYAWDGSNARFNKLIRTPYSEIELNRAMKLAVDWSRKALTDDRPDPSNGAFWWDGLDFKTNYANHPKVRDGFKWGSASHNIFGVQEKRREVIVRWKIRNKKTGKIVDGGERGRYDSVWVSTAAHGGTVFWLHNPDYLKASGGKAYR